MVVINPADKVIIKYIKYFLKYTRTDLLKTLLYTIFACSHIGIDTELIVVPKNIPISPNLLARIIEIIKLIAASIIGAYLSGVKIPAFSLKIEIDFLNPVK